MDGIIHVFLSFSEGCRTCNSYLICRVLKYNIWLLSVVFDLVGRCPLYRIGVWRVGKSSGWGIDVLRTKSLGAELAPVLMHMLFGLSHKFAY